MGTLLEKLDAHKSRFVSLATLLPELAEIEECSVNHIAEYMKLSNSLPNVIFVADGNYVEADHDFGEGKEVLREIEGGGLNGGYMTDRFDQPLYESKSFNKIGFMRSDIFLWLTNESIKIPNCLKKPTNKNTTNQRPPWASTFPAWAGAAWIEKDDAALLLGGYQPGDSGILTVAQLIRAASDDCWYGVAPGPALGWLASVEGAISEGIIRTNQAGQLYVADLTSWHKTNHRIQKDSTWNNEAIDGYILKSQIVELANPQIPDFESRVQALEAERDQERLMLANTEARAVTAERERDELRERLAEIERKMAERPALEFLHPSARLLRLVAEVQRKFWPDWKPGDGSNGCQDAALQWLKETHGLSHAEAQAVERVAAPISRDPAKKNPQG